MIRKWEGPEYIHHNSSSASSNTRVEFWYGMDFAGSHYYMIVDGGGAIGLGRNHPDKMAELAVKVLSEVWGISIAKDDIVWQWNGTL